MKKPEIVKGDIYVTREEYFGPDFPKLLEMKTRNLKMLIERECEAVFGARAEVSHPAV